MALENIGLAKLTNIEKSQAALCQMHKEVGDRISEARTKLVLHHNKKTNVVLPSFYLCDYVMVPEPNYKRHKNSFRWIGPRQITSVITPVV